MFKNKEFAEVYSQIESFNQLLENYSLNQKEANEETRVSILYNYDKNLKDNFRNLIQCIEEKKDNKFCISNFKETFVSIRSDTSQQIENINKNKE